MKLRLAGQGVLSVGKTDFVAGGGEGDVYAKGSVAVKLYHDPAKMIPAGKVAELRAIGDPDVIKPEQMVFDDRGRPVGYTMRFLRDTHALCQLFPPAFRLRNGIGPDTTLALVRALQQRVESIHRAGVLVVDLNELNFLVDAGFSSVYAIDVDSYQTAHYPATAIMASVRDPQVKDGRSFTELSDWFSFAVVSFNLLVGIHPYRGRHPSVDGLEERMRAGISVFHPEVSVPRVVLGFDVIPDVYRAWYRAVLEEGRRLPPPSDLHATVTVLPTVRHVGGTDRLDIREVYGYGAPVVGFWDHRGATLTATTDGIYVGHRRVHDAVPRAAAVGFSRRGRAVVAGTSGGMLRLLDAEAGAPLPVQLRADAVMSYRGTIYVRSRDKLLEVVLGELADGLVAGTRPAGGCLEHATALFPGVAIQSLLGATWATVFPQPGSTHPLAVAELDPYRVLDARFDGGVLMVLGARHADGRHDRLVFRFDATYRSYDLRVVEGVTPAAVDFVTLDTGVCVCLDEAERLELTSARQGSSSQVQLVDDPVLGGDMTLRALGGRVGLVRGNRVYVMGLR